MTNKFSGHGLDCLRKRLDLDTEPDREAVPPYVETQEAREVVPSSGTGRSDGFDRGGRAKGASADHAVLGHRTERGAQRYLPPPEPRYELNSCAAA